MHHLASVYAPWDGNAEALAADIGEKPVTVRQWRNRGNIPPQYWPAIMKAAAAKGFKLDWVQFLPEGVDPPPPFQKRPRRTVDRNPVEAQL